MDQRAVDSLMREIAPVVKDFVSQQIQPLLIRIAELEARKPEKGERGDPGERGEKGDPGSDGKDGVNGKDGADGLNGKDGAPGQDGKDGTNGKDGSDGKDGVGLAGAVIDKDGDLVITMTNGSIQKLGRVIGKDGDPGRDGKDGEPGKDGIPLKGWSAKLADDQRTILLSLTDGEVEKVEELTFPVSIHRGTFNGGEYVQGDQVTYGGSTWTAMRSTSQRPEGPDSGWWLTAKRGQHGKDGKPGERGEKGPKGDKGDRWP